ncbi:MAG: hydantoinase/oxoprolinase family protein, partial [Alphaproteobacteria bacterium]|nr:hydantoinase/oxoprolinase family protein [Alphaproteobacteria bacterium]
INTVGAGGGSIAWRDVGGFLNVGPRSAGAYPGPACYGQGGEAATVTDANLLLGRLSAEAPLGGAIRLNQAAAAAAVESLADALGVAPLQMADGIVKLAVARMTTAVKEISIMRGHDPRDFSLFAYGGAGPMHAAAVAAELAIARMVIPPLPGNFSALGLLAADVRYDHVSSRLAPLAELSLAALQAAFDEMRDRGREALTAEGVPAAAMRFLAALDLRYRGQAFELTVAMPEDAGTIADVEAAFRHVYAERYGEAPEDPAELVCLRLSAVGALAKPEVALTAGGDLAAARLGGARVAFDAEPCEADLYDRDRLPAEAAFRGPALVLEAGATTVVPPGHRVRVDGFGNLIMEREA